MGPAAAPVDGIIPLPMERDRIVILDFGSQYTQLIARRLRELQVYSEILPPGTKASVLRTRRPKGIVLSGGPTSVHDKGAPRPDKAIFEMGVPVLGVCYGMQVMSLLLGGDVQRSGTREYGQATFETNGRSRLLSALPAKARVWMSHGDSIRRPPGGFTVVGSSESNPVAAVESAERKLYGIMFHPEVNHSEGGTAVLARFLDLTQEAVAKVEEEVGKERVLCALSGGVDSAVAALIVHEAIGDRLTCVFVDNGLLRKDEREQVKKRFADKLKLKVVTVDASKRFLTKLKGVTDPERKRKIIGKEFIDVFRRPRAAWAR
jgi:GMP synthase (glutamine-hydrolysing)